MTFGSSRLPVIWLFSNSTRSRALPPVRLPELLALLALLAAFGAAFLAESTAGGVNVAFAAARDAGNAGVTALAPPGCVVTAERSTAEVSTAGCKSSAAVAITASASIKNPTDNCRITV
jgi:hypothetical protein